MRVLDDDPSFIDPVLEEDSNSQGIFQDITNSQNNKRYQHHEYIGLLINEDKDKGIYRVIGGNPNGLKLNAKGGELSEYIEEAKHMSADTIALYEINLDTHIPVVTKLIHDTSQQLFDFQKTSFTSSTIPSKNHYKPGGTLLITNGKCSGRVVSSGVDNMGRWT